MNTPIDLPGHPPFSANPHVYLDLNPAALDADPASVVESITVTAPDGTVTEIDPASGVTGTTSEGGEQPSANPKATAASAGTDSSESSKPESKSTTSGAKPSPKPAPNAGNQ